MRTLGTNEIACVNGGLFGKLAKLAVKAFKSDAGKAAGTGVGAAVGEEALEQAGKAGE